MKPGLLSSRFFIPIIYIVHVQTIGMSLSLQFTNGSIERNNFTFFLQGFRFCFCKVDDLFVLQEPISQLLSGSEKLNKVSSFPRTG